VLRLRIFALIVNTFIYFHELGYKSQTDRINDEMYKYNTIQYDIVLAKRCVECKTTLKHLLLKYGVAVPAGSDAVKS